MLTWAIRPHGPLSSAALPLRTRLTPLPRSGHPVVKAFNTIRAQHLLTLGKPAGTPGRIALPVAGDDASAKAVVIGLIDQLGFASVDVGGLDDSWRQQPGTPVYITDLDAEEVRKALAAASLERPAEWRA